MEDRIEIGEYVRVNNDNRNCIGIGKVTRIVNESIYVNMNNKYNLPVSFQIDNIVKHSKQLIDLIEIGDFVNGHKVKAIYLNGATKYIKLSNSYENGQGTRTYEEDIKTILTKEQYEVNCYKVGGEE